MTGTYMLTAFILGFWCIWSANRDVKSLAEALVFIVITLVAKALMEWSGMPNLDGLFWITWGVLFIYVAVVLEAVERFSSSMGVNMTIAIGAPLAGISWRNMFSAKAVQLIWPAFYLNFSVLLPCRYRVYRFFLPDTRAASEPAQPSKQAA